MAALPPSEDPIPDYKARREEARAELAQRDAAKGEYWIDITGRIWHVSEMHSRHIEKCLDMLWRNAVKQAAIENETQAQIKVDRVIRHVFLNDIWSDDVDAYIDWTDVQKYLDQLVDPKTIWESAPFVQLALLVLRNRDYVYEKPWERDLPF